MKKIFVIMFCIIIIQKTNASDFKFGWSFGDIEIYYDFLYSKSNANLQLLKFDWVILEKYGFGVSAFEYQKINQNKKTYAILPVEFSYSPINYEELLYFSIYGKAGWQFSPTNSFYGAVGTRLLLFPSFKFYYSCRISAFIEYNTFKELKVGLSLDLGSIIAGILLAKKDSIEKNHENRIEGKPDLDDKDRID